jgi:phage terminase large subunit GpA-like protein
MLGCAAAFQTWQSLVLEYLRGVDEYEATGSEAKLKATTNTDQGLPYLPKSRANARTADELTARAESWPRGEVPEGVRWLQMVADVQKTSFVVQVFGHGLDRERWLIDRYSIQISDRITHTGERDTLDPAGYIEDWQKLTEATKKTYPLSDGSGRRMGIQFVGCDSGGYSKKKTEGENTGVTSRAYTWWRGLRKSGMFRRVRLLKGGSTQAGPSIKETKPEATNKRDRHSGARGDVPVLILNTDQLKDAMSADLQRSDPGPGYVHLPEWLEDNVFEEFVSEARGPKGWDKLSQQTRNEAWDLLVYDHALALFFGGDRIKNGKEPAWARPWNEGNVGFVKAGDNNNETQNKRASPPPIFQASSL